MSLPLYEIALFFPVFLFSLSFHESAHAWMANRLGDSTAREMGRLTLNPLPHIDLFGTILFPLMGFLMPGGFFIGWAKPVPVNPLNLRGGRKGDLRVSAAGPLSNLILAVLFALPFHLPVRGLPPFVFEMLMTGLYLNLGLAFFNLIPLHPLDGAGVLAGLLPERYLNDYYRISRYSFLILFLLLWTGGLRIIMMPVRFMAGVLLP